MIQTDEPEKLYSFFTNTLQLPVAWPLATYKFAQSGGVGLGNVNIEVIRFSQQRVSASGAPKEWRLLGIAFEPIPLADSLAELNRRSIAYGEQRPYFSAESDGSNKLLWTNVTLPQFSDAAKISEATLFTFLCEYSPSHVNVAERRARLREQLISNNGGPLGVDSVKEVLIGATDLEAATRLWQKLLEPAPSYESSAWQVGGGPVIHLVRDKENRIQGLIISVASLPRAKSFLRTKDLLGVDSEKEVRIDPTKVYGLNLRLVQKG
jgi:hypothetical protein